MLPGYRGALWVQEYSPNTEVPFSHDKEPFHGQAKQSTKLDLTDAYYWIRIKKGNKWKTAF